MTIDVRKLMDRIRQQLERDEAEGRLAGTTVKDLEDALSHPAAPAEVDDALAAEAGSVRAGDPAPDFTLPWLPGHEGSDEPTFTLSEHRGRRPVALVFGSYT